MTHETDREHRKPAGDVQPAKPEVTDPPLSNRLTVLADRVGEAFRLGRSKSVEAAQAYLDCGSMLAEAKAECDHGEWIPFLKRAGIPERTAQRMMKLAASGESAETLADKGIKAALAGMVQRGKNDTVTDLEDDPTPTETPDPPSTRRKAIRAERHAEGLCVDCRQPCDGEARCKWCRREFRAAFLKLEAAVLERAGIEPRVACNMMTLAEAGHIGETLHEAVGVNAALADLRRKSGREKSESDSDFPRMDAMLPELKAAAKKRNGIRLSAGQVSALVDAVAWTAPPYGDGNGSEETFVSTEVAKATLLRRPLPGEMKRVLRKLYGAHPGFVPAEELLDAAGLAPPKFAAMMESFHFPLVGSKPPTSSRILLQLERIVL